MKMNSKYAGRCKCGAHFERGASVNYDKVSRKITACPTCSADHRVDLDEMLNSSGGLDSTYEDQCADICGR